MGKGIEWDKTAVHVWNKIKCEKADFSRVASRNLNQKFSKMQLSSKEKNQIFD